jgi:parallel beta-helix repeat protein
VDGNTIAANQDSGILLLNSGGEDEIGNRISDNDISDHPYWGIYVSDSRWNWILGNRIHHNFEDGILFDEGSSDNFVGKDALVLTALANEIFGNSGAGVRVASGVRNRISGNSIYDNGELGIDLGPDGVTANDYLDADGGANLLQNFVEFTYADWDGTTLVFWGTLNSAPSSGYLVEFYLNATVDASGHGEGRWYLGSLGLTTDATGYAEFNNQLPLSAPSGTYYLTALVTDEFGNTSEFAMAIAVQSV